MSWEVRYSREDRLHTVGSVSADGTWHALKDCANDQEAIDTIHFLNGGNANLLERIATALEEIQKSCADNFVNIGLHR